MTKERKRARGTASAGGAAGGRSAGNTPQGQGQGPALSSQDEDLRRGQFASEVMAEVSRATQGRRPAAPSKIPLLFAALALCGAYFFYPCKFRPKLVEVGEAVDWTGVLDPDSHNIDKVEQLYPRLLHAPSALTFSKTGVLYVATGEGAIWKWPGHGQPVVVAHVGNVSCTYPEEGPRCGLVVGLQLTDDESALYVTDAYYGLLQISLPAGHVERLLSVGQPIPGDLPANLLFGVVVKDDVVYFTDITTRWKLSENVHLALEAQSDGRILQYNTKTRKFSVLTKGLQGPSGLLLSQDGQHLLVLELTGLKFLKVNLPDGTATPVATSLPGYPKTLHRHPDGGYLVGMPLLRSGLVDYLLVNPWIRKLNYKFVPQFLVKDAVLMHSICLHLSEDGEVLDSFHDNDGHVVNGDMRCAAHGEHIYFFSAARGTGLSRKRLAGH